MDLVSDNKRMAKNTFTLYCRTFVVMLVSLYTSRVVLRVLGVDDFGIYNVVGGIVVVFSFISTTLSSASQRYIAYELPRNDEKSLQELFSLILLSYGTLSIGIFITAEIIGSWFLNTYLNIPEDRIIAANWVLQFSILDFVVNILNTPYMAIVIAHEQMKVFAYLSIAKAVITLISAYILKFILYDHLIVYAFLMFLCTLMITSFYRYYCKKHYKESHFLYYYNKEKIKEITAYLWWSMFGPIANIIRNQVINILLNLYFGPAINAARAISYQVNTAVNSFSSNFYSALRPQITKNYSAGNVDRMRNLIYSSSRFSFFLLLLLAVPVFFNTEQILIIWLGSYPNYSVVFLKLILLTSLIEVFNMPLTAGLLATGKIRIHQQVIAAIYIMNLPVSIILLNAGYDAECTFYVNMALVIIALIPRVYLCQKYYGLNVPEYVFDVLLRCLIVLITCFVTGGLVTNIIHNKFNNGIFGLIACVLPIFFSVLIIIWLVGIKRNERLLIKTQIVKFMRKGN